MRAPSIGVDCQQARQDVVNGAENRKSKKAQDKKFLLSNAKPTQTGDRANLREHPDDLLRSGNKKEHQASEGSQNRERSFDQLVWQMVVSGRPQLAIC